MPSFLSVIYLVMFLGISVYWSLMFRFHMKAYGILKRLLFGYLILHMVLLYLCQLGPVQEWLDHETKHLVSRSAHSLSFFLLERTKKNIIGRTLANIFFFIETDQGFWINEVMLFTGLALPTM